MDSERTRSREGISRRSALATLGACLAFSTAGCVDRVQSAVNGSDDDQLSVTITTVPADEDRQIVRIARVLEDHLERVGVNVSFDMRSRSEYLRTILIDHDFDLYVGRHPGGTDPDFLYEALHGDYASRGEIGWQNPFGVTSRTLDNLLEAQRREADGRGTHVREILEWINREQPFTPICVPEEYRLHREDLFDDGRHLTSWVNYLSLNEDLDAEQVDVSIIDSRPTRNLNPLAPEYHEDERILGLLYDSLVAEVDGEFRPWLAEDLEWNDEGSRLTVTLREDLRWHDGMELDVDDVSFTYRLLGLDEKDDITPGNLSTPPRYRGAASIVDDILIDPVERMVEFRLSSRRREVGLRALTVPVLPKHVWDDRAERADEVDIHPRTNGVIETSNMPPIGSGPYAFESQSNRDHLTLEIFDEEFTAETFDEEIEEGYEHFTLRDDVDLPEPTVEQLRFVNDPGSQSAVERVESGGADVTGTNLESHAVPGEGATPDGISRHRSPSRTFYHVGYNHRRRPFNNTHCRRLVSRVLDRTWITREIFNDYARPTATPITDEWVPEEWLPGHLELDDEDPSFFGSDGDLDVEAARASLERVGFRYDGDGRLLAPESW
ncbi:ABC transporter substrate-binding protein [Natrialbaceae archaeon A-gly3]